MKTKRLSICAVIGALSCCTLGYSLMLDDDMLPGNSSEMRKMVRDHMEVEALTEDLDYVDPRSVSENAFYAKLNNQDRAIYNTLNGPQRAFVLRIANMNVQFQMSHSITQEQDIAAQRATRRDSQRMSDRQDRGDYQRSAYN